MNLSLKSKIFCEGNKMKLVLIIFVLTTFILSCDTYLSSPSNIPSDAVFVDDDNLGGVFMQCDQNPDKENTYKCVIYSNRNGEILSEGIWTVASGNRVFNPKDKEIYKSYKVGRIFLRDNRCLVRVNPDVKNLLDEDPNVCE